MDDLRLPSFDRPLRAVIIGGGGIGGALAAALRDSPDVAALWSLSRRPGADAPLDLTDEASIRAAAEAVREGLGAPDLVIVATGVLHGRGMAPEKSWSALSSDAFARAFAVNAAGPALVAKHFLPLLPKGRKAVFAALSARVGSIEDNRLGGWHAYRASKAALNQILKTLSVELSRRNPTALCVGLHPGTVDTALSAPFQGNVAPEKLFTPERSARALLSVIDGLGPADTGGVFAWDGARIPA